MRSLFTILLLTTSFSCFSQFEVKDVVGLFAKAPNDVRNFLQENKYQYQKKEMSIEKYQQHTLLGDYIANISFNSKTQKLSNFQFYTNVANGMNLIQALDDNSFEWKDIGNNNQQGLYIGCMYAFQNITKKLQCTLIRPIQNSNLIVLTFSKI